MIQRQHVLALAALTWVFIAQPVRSLAEDSPENPSQDTPATTEPSAAEPSSQSTAQEPASNAGEDQQPIAMELVQGVNLLNSQITEQQALLDTAQTDREKQLIHNHIRSLQKERRSLKSLLEKLVGPNYEVLESTKEHQAEQQSERYEKVLEKERP